MATQVSKAVRLKLVMSHEVDGKIRTKSRTFSSISANATDDGLLMAGNAIGRLQAQEPDEVRRIDEITLM